MTRPRSQSLDFVIQYRYRCPELVTPPRSRSHDIVTQPRTHSPDLITPSRTRCPERNALSLREQRRIARVGVVRDHLVDVVAQMRLVDNAYALLGISRRIPNDTMRGRR